MKYQVAAYFSLQLSSESKRFLLNKGCLLYRKRVNLQEISMITEGEATGKIIPLESHFAADDRIECIYNGDSEEEAKEIRDFMENDPAELSVEYRHAKEEKHFINF